MTDRTTSDWQLLERTMSNVNARAHALVELSSELVAQAQAPNEDLRNLATVTESLTAVAPMVHDALEGDDDD